MYNILHTNQTIQKTKCGRFKCDSLLLKSYTLNDITWSKVPIAYIILWISKSGVIRAVE